MQETEGPFRWQICPLQAAAGRTVVAAAREVYLKYLLRQLRVGYSPRRFQIKGNCYLTIVAIGSNVTYYNI
jgi:hypothetical protein